MKKSSYYPDGLTVSQLKSVIKGWPDYDRSGEPTEVWIATGKNLSSPVTEIMPLNSRTGKNGESWWNLELKVTE